MTMKVQGILLFLIAFGVQYGEGQYRGGGMRGWQMQSHYGGSWRGRQNREAIAIIEEDTGGGGGLLSLPGQILRNLGLIPDGGGPQGVGGGFPNGGFPTGQGGGFQGVGGGFRNGGFPRNGRSVRCKMVMNTVFTEECQVKFEEVCETTGSVQPVEQPKTECRTVPETQCVPVTRTVPDKQCTTTTERQCVAEDQTIHETKYEENCRNVEHKSCDQPGSSGIVPRTNAYSQGRQLVMPPRVYKREAHWGGYGGRPSHSANRDSTSQTISNCQTMIQRICDSVPKQVARVIQVPKCQDVPKTECIDTVKTVQDTECTETTREECIEIPAAPSARAPAASCQQVPWKMCQKVARQVPKKVCKRPQRPRQGYAHQPELIAIIEF